MKINAQVEDAHLVVAVSFTNERDETVYLKNWLWDWYGILGIDELNEAKNPKTAPPTRELAYACAGAPDELVLLNGDGPDCKGNIFPTVPRLPECTRLKPGDSYYGRIRLPLPILEWYAYENPVAAPTEAVSVRTIRYVLESLPESACQRPATEMQYFTGVFQVNGYPDNVHTATAELPRPITLLRRTDDFTRFG